MIHTRETHHEELTALPVALALTTILWPWLRSYWDKGATKDKTNKQPEDKHHGTTKEN